MKDKIRVAAGVIFDDCQRVLVQQRARGAHQGGLWEFPGGKLEPGESPLEALERELLEEIGIQLISAGELMEIEHDYGDKTVILEVFIVHDYAGKPLSLQNQPVRWLSPDALSGMPMPAADRPVVDRLRKGRDSMDS